MKLYPIMQIYLLCTKALHILALIGCRRPTNTPRLLHLLLGGFSPSPRLGFFFVCFFVDSGPGLGRISVLNRQVLTSQQNFPYNSKFSIRTMPADEKQGEPARASMRTYIQAGHHRAELFFGAIMKPFSRTTHEATRECDVI